MASLFDRDVRLVIKELRGLLDEVSQQPDEDREQVCEVLNQWLASQARDESEHLVELWNQTGATTCTRMSPARKAKLAQRLKDPWWRQHWREAVEKVATVPGLLGKNDRGWKASIDWFLRPDSVTHILEGKYDNWAKQESKFEHRRSNNQAAFAAVFGTEDIAEEDIPF